MFLFARFEVRISAGALQADGKENESKDRNTSVDAKATASAQGANAAAPKEFDVSQDGEGTRPSRWALHCHATLGAISAAAVLKASS